MINQCVLDCHLPLDCAMKNGFCSINESIVMQILAEVRKIKNKNGSDYRSLNKKHTLGEGKQNFIVVVKKKKRYHNFQILSPVDKII